MIRKILYLLCCLSSLSLLGQDHTFSGYIEDAESGEKLIGATIYVADKEIGTVSNTYGFFSLTLPASTYKVQFSYIGYQSQEFEIQLDKDLQENIRLQSTLTLKEVEIIGETAEQIQEETQMSTIDVPVEQIKALPAFMGEVDILKTIQLLPGVQSGSEGNSGIYVRGGGPDQNLILLDGVPVYNVSHLFGFFSVFNADAIKNVELIKGGFPARYGGRLSSVLNISMKEGNNKEFHGEGSIGLVASKLTLEGPIIKDKTSFIISGRRTYIDLLARPLIKSEGSDSYSETYNDITYTNEESANAGYYFYDLNAKINHKLGEKDRLYLSVYTGRDKGFFEEEYTSENNHISDPNIYGMYYDKTDFSLSWGNFIGALRWNHEFSNKLFANTTLTYSRYDFTTGSSYESENEFSDYQYDNNGNQVVFSDKYNDSGLFEYVSDIRDIGAKIDFDYVPNPKHYIKFGYNGMLHRFRPGILSLSETSQNDDYEINLNSNDVNAVEMYIYGEDDFKVSPRFKMNIGLHASMFSVRDTSYFSLQPRFSGRFLLTDQTSVKASYANMTQYLHLLTNSSLTLPTDLWVSPTDIIGPQRSWQVALGVAHNLNSQFEVSLEGYYKEMDDLISYKEGTSFVLIGDTWEDKVTVGKGKSYGLEFFIQKKKGKTTGWLGYTLSWTTRQFPGGLHPVIPNWEYAPINFGNEYPYKYDRRHDISLTISHKFNDRIDMGIVWVYGTGNAITLSESQYIDADSFNPLYSMYGFYANNIQQYGEKNSVRMAAYHRLDIGLNIHTNPKWGEGTWSFGAYNVYNRKNPFFIYTDNEFDPEAQQSKTVFKQVSLFPIIPSISYAFKF